jgi:hypothetical protein
MIDEHGLTGMSPAELATAYPDARAVTQRFDDAAFLEVYDGLDHDPALLIRALGQLGEYIRMGDEAERNYLAKLPEGTQVSVPELHANDIDDAIEGLLDRLDPQTRFGVESAARSPEGRQLRDKVGLHAHGCNGGRGGVCPYSTFSQVSTLVLSAAVAVSLFPSNTSARGSNGSVNWRRPPSTVTGALRV